MDVQKLGEAIVDLQLPAVSIGDVTVTEGDTGSLDATLTVNLSKAATQSRGGITPTSVEALGITNPVCHDKVSLC